MTKPKTKIFRIILFSILALIVATIGWFTYSIAHSVGKITSDSDGKNGILSIFDKNKTIKGQAEGRTNVLLLGNGGAEHGGSGGLTDTMIVMSINWTDKKVAMISIPRDLWVKVPVAGYTYAKINSVYTYAEEKKSITGGGGKVDSALISEILGISIHYYVSMDFNGFKNIIDTIGGVDINVDNSFTDYTYPAGECNDATGKGCSVMTVRFVAGIQHMDGTRALIYTRSRHSLDNNEGSDFARSRRQQKVISAIKEKIFSVETLSNPKKITDLINVLGDHLKTNLSISEVQTIGNEMKSVDTTNIINKVLSNEAGGVLVHPEDDGRGWILTPRLGVGNYAEIQKIAINIFNTTQVQPELKIQVLNSSSKVGIANQVAQLLKSHDYNVTSVGNTTSVVADKTVIYNCGGTATSEAATKLAGILNATVKTKTSCGDIDIQVVVGQNSI